MTRDGNSTIDLSEQVKQLTQQLLHAQRLTALGELVSTTTHEFNNVLTTIINYAKLGLRNRDDASRSKAFEKILAAGERAAKITNSVLAMARNRSDAFEPTDLAVIIRETMFLLEREFTKYRVQVEYQLADVPPVLAIGNQIQQVLLNLLINARQAMPNGGQIVIRLDLDVSRSMVDLVVRDSGVGIPQDKLRRIFDPFFTTKAGPDESGKGGSGLGLSCCKNVIDAHRGRLRVESTPGKGTAFTVKLPIAQSNPSPPHGLTSATTLTAETGR